MLATGVCFIVGMSKLLGKKEKCTLATLWLPQKWQSRDFRRISGSESGKVFINICSIFLLVVRAVVVYKNWTQ